MEIFFFLSVLSFQLASFIYIKEHTHWSTQTTCKQNYFLANNWLPLLFCMPAYMSMKKRKPKKKVKKNYCQNQSAVEILKQVFELGKSKNHKKWLDKNVKRKKKMKKFPKKINFKMKSETECLFILRFAWEKR